MGSGIKPDGKQVNFYKENGYLLTGQSLFSTEKFQKLVNIFEQLLSKYGNEKGDELDVPHFKDSRLFEFLIPI